MNKELDDESGILLISRGTSILLLFVYCAYLYFQVSCHFLASFNLGFLFGIEI
jgi:hypothetical protein